jgi:hypothetical protein
MLNEVVKEIGLSDRAVLACRRLGKGKMTPENRVLLRFHTASAELSPMMTGAERLSPDLQPGLTATAALMCLTAIPSTQPFPLRTL